ncbi:MAG: hypothetical protein SFV54_07650 [Bryobacteraceae bacterium]|nr:hypothetical protein [Bryobacteraceae bacterium]
MVTIDVRLTVDEAHSLMRAIAAKEWAERDASRREELELLRTKLYDSIYRSGGERLAAVGSGWNVRSIDSRPLQRKAVVRALPEFRPAA